MYPDSVTLRIRPTPASRLPAFWRRVLKHVPALAWLLSSRAAMSSSPLTCRSPRSTTMSSSRCSSRSGMQTRATRPSAVVSGVSWSSVVPSLRPPSHGIARGIPGQWPCGAPRVLGVCVRCLPVSRSHPLPWQEDRRPLSDLGKGSRFHTDPAWGWSSGEPAASNGRRK